MAETNSFRQSPRSADRADRGSPRRGLSFATVVGMAAVVLLLVFPSTSATYRIEVTPPYEGVVAQVSSSTYTTGCHSSARFIVPTFASNRSGRVGSEERTVASTCSGEPYPQSATTANAIVLQGPDFTVPVSGEYNVAFVWRFSFELSLSVRGNASNFVYGVIETYDLIYVPSNQSYFNVDSHAALYHEIHLGAYQNKTQNTTDVFEARLSLQGGLVYQFQTVLVCGTDSILMGPGDAVAELNFASDGNGGQLRSMSVFN